MRAVQKEIREIIDEKDQYFRLSQWTVSQIAKREKIASTVTKEDHEVTSAHIT